MKEVMYYDSDRGGMVSTVELARDDDLGEFGRRMARRAAQQTEPLDQSGRWGQTMPKPSARIERPR
jgi:hypothetical protein